MYSLLLMPRTDSYQDYENFDDWESFELDDDIYAGTESDLLDDWEDDGAIAEIRETPIVNTKPEKEVELDESPAEVFSLLERVQSKRDAKLDGIEGPSEDELSKIENIGIDEYIDEVLNEESLVAENNSVITDLVENDQDEEEVQDKDDIHVEVIEDLETEQVEPEITMSFGEEFENDETGLVVQPIFEGIACALPTLFDEEGEAEYKTTARLAKRLAQQNATAIFVATPAGEGQTLSVDEHKNLVAEVAKALPETILVADVSAPSIRQSVVLAHNAVEAKADALVVELSSNTKDAYALCNAIHEKEYDVPLLVRLVGNPAELPITPEFLFDLPINGVIDETANADFMLHLASIYTGPIYCGAISTILLASALNLAGVVTSSATIADDLVQNAFEGDVQAQLELAASEREFGGFSPLRIKQALAAQDLISSETRD